MVRKVVPRSASYIVETCDDCPHIYESENGTYCTHPNGTRFKLFRPDDSIPIDCPLVTEPEDAA